MTPRKILYHLIAGCSTVAIVAVFCIVFIVQDDVGISTLAGKNHLFAQILPILTLCTIVQLLLARSRRLPIHATDLLIVGVAGYLLCTYYFVTGGIYTKLMLLGTLGSLYLNLRILFNASPRLIRLLTLVIIVSGIVEAVTGLSQLYGFARSNHALFRMTGSFFNPGPYSNYLALIVPIALYHILKSKPQTDIPIGGIGSALRAVDLNRLLHAASWIVLFLSILVLPAARGRIAWVAVGVTGVILILRETQILSLCKNFYRRRKGVSWIIGICCVTVPLIVAVGIYNFKRDSANGRLLIWKVITTQMIPANPLVGVGQGYFAGCYGDAQMKYFATQEESESERRVAGSPEYAFNDSLQIVAESGWIGGVLFGGILGLALYGLARMRSALFYGLVSLLILMQASYPLNLLPFCILLIFFTAAAQDGFQKPVFYLQKPVIPAILLCGVLVWSLFAARREQARYTILQDWKLMQFSYTMGDYKLANREYRMMYEQLYDEPRFVFEHGHALNKTGLYRESNAVLRQGSRLSSDPMFYNIIGNNYKMLGDYPAAAHYYQKAHDLLPNRLYPLYLLAKLYAETGQNDKAAEAAERVRQFDPKVSSSATRDMKEEIDKLIPAVCSPDYPD